MIVCILQLYLLYSLHENGTVIEQEHVNPDKLSVQVIRSVLFFSAQNRVSRNKNQETSDSQNCRRQRM